MHRKRAISITNSPHSVKMHLTGQEALESEDTQKAAGSMTPIVVTQVWANSSLGMVFYNM